MNKYLILLLGLLLIVSSVWGVSHYEENPLPIGLTEEEMLRLDEIGMSHTSTAPPVGGFLRNPAEWEPSEGVIIRYPLGIPVSIVAEMSEDIIVTTIVASTSYQNSATSYYTSSGVNMANTEFIIAPTNTYWTRDYGPWFIFQDEEMAIVDPIYNRPRPQDDVIPQTIGTQWGLSVYGLDLETPGGNHMSNGLGTSSSTRLVLDENSALTEAEIDSMMLAYLGNEYIILGYIESGGIHHIDCWAKFVSPTTILVKDVPASSSSYNLLNARAEFLSQQISPYGVPYNVVRLYCPYGTAYTNSVILNDKVIVPTFGISEDATALQTYQDAMPGYEIIGFNGSWLDDDAIHCRTMGVPDRGMLYLEHTPLYFTTDTLNDYDINVNITNCSGDYLVLDSLKVYYSIDGGAYQSVPLTVNKTTYDFGASIPAQTGGTEISYYIKAADESGRVETHPYIGEAGAHIFKINMVPEIVSSDSALIKTSSEFSYYPEFIDNDDTVHTITYSNYSAWLTVVNDSIIGTAPADIDTSEFTVEVSDPYSSSSQTVDIEMYKCADVDVTNEINIADLVFMVEYMFNSGPAPEYLISGNVNAIDEIDIADLVFLVDYMFESGPDPICE